MEDPNTWVDPLGLDCKNKREGLRREDTLRRILEDIYGKDNVLRERMLLDKDGNKVNDPKGKGRRIDFIILDDNGNAIKSYEVTSKTANKNAQERKEKYIRSNGGIKIKNQNGDLVDVSSVPTQTIRIK